MSSFCQFWNFVDIYNGSWDISEKRKKIQKNWSISGVWLSREKRNISGLDTNFYTLFFDSCSLYLGLVLYKFIDQ